jgi:hypothetical protein
MENTQNKAFAIVSGYGLGHRERGVQSYHKTESAAKAALRKLPSDCYVIDVRDL